MKKITATLLAVLMILALCACEKPVEFSEQTSVTEQKVSAEEIIAETTETVEADSVLPEAVKKIVDFTRVEAGEYDETLVNDLDYYTNLIADMYDLPYWKASSTAAIILGYEPTKTQEQVVTYLNGRAPKGFALLFDAFFFKRYSTDEIIEYARAYAYYLTKASLENHSFADYISNDYREEWYKAVGCTREYVYDDYDKLIENGKYRRLPEVTEARIGKHYWVYGVEDWVKDAEELYELIYKGLKDMDAVEEVIKADAPHFFETYDKDFYAVLELHGDLDGASYTRNTNYGGYITLSHGSHIPHEYVHALTARATGADNRWLCEGIAEYYSEEKVNKETFVSSDLVDFMEGTADITLGEDLDPDYCKKLKEKMVEARETYDLYKEKYGDTHCKEMYAFVAMAEKEIETGFEMFGYNMLDAYEGQFISKTTLDKDLSYASACVLAKELIKDFDADKVLTFLYVGGSFKVEFGMTSREYLEKVRERGSYKLGFFDDTPYNND